MTKFGGRSALLLVGLLACGTLPTTDDGGADAATGDAPNDTTTVADTGSVDSGVDSTTDAALDVAKDNFVPKPDAPFVDLDASTAPWVVNFGTGSILSVAVDANKNVAAAGTLGTNSYLDFFVEVVDASGTLQWKKDVGSSSPVNHTASAVTFDSSGNVYVAGYVGDAVDLGGGPVGPGEIVVKYDANGVFQWEYGPFTSSIFTNLKTKSNGNLLIAGVLNGTQNYGGGSLAPTGNTDAVLIELTPTKSHVKSKNWGAQGDQSIIGLAVDYADAIFVGGSFESSIDFGGGALTGPQPGTGHNMFIAKLDSSWGYEAQVDLKASATNSSVHTIATDWAGNLFVTVTAYGSVSLGGNTLTPLGQADIVFGKLDANLGHVFSKIFGDTYGQVVVGAAADPTGGAAITGGYSGTFNIGLGPIPTASTTSDALFAAQFNIDGGPLAAFGSGSEYGTGQSMAYIAWPDFVIGGQCYGTLTLPGGALTCSSNGNAFIARMKP